MTEALSPILGRRLDARFTLLEKLGSGGQGEVWRAHDDTRGIDIALKVPASATATNDSVLAAFEREHAIAARLEHSSVLKVFPPHRSGEVVVLPMELATGGDLRRLRGSGYLDIIPVLLDIAQALEHAHERGVIHRDLKPGNVLFDARGRVKLADFGAAGTTSTTAADARLQGLSPFTASPEQLRGEAPTESDDIYGLGALAYELLSGYPPYYPHFDLRKAQEEPVPPLVPTRQIPPLLTALVTRMLAKNRRERPRSMREVIDELDAALNDTLAFDFESIVDPAHGAPSAAVLVGPAPVARTVAPAAARPEPRPAAPPPPKKAEDEYLTRDGDDFEEEESEREDEEEEEGPDLGLIPDLLVANALVATPTPKGNRAGSQSATPAVVPPTSKAPGEQQPRAADARATQNQPLKPRETPAAVSERAAAQSRKSDAQIARNETMHLPHGPASPTRGGATTRPSDGEMLHNDTIYLPPESAASKRGGTAAPRASDAQLLHNDTMHLPPDPASNTRGGAAGAWRTSNADTSRNDTMQLPPDPATPKRGGAAAARPSDAQMLHNDTMHLPPDPASTTRGGTAGARRTSNADTVHNDTMHLPPEPTPNIRGVGAAWRASNAQSVNNDTMQLPPEPTSATRGAAVASRGSHAHAANDQSARPQSTSTRGRTSPPPAAASPPRYVAQRPTAADEPFEASEILAPRERAPQQPADAGGTSPSTWKPQPLQQAGAGAGADTFASPDTAAASSRRAEASRTGASNLGGGPNQHPAPNRGAAPIRGAAPKLAADSNLGVAARFHTGSNLGAASTLGADSNSGAVARFGADPDLSAAAGYGADSNSGVAARFGADSNSGVAARFAADPNLGAASTFGAGANVSGNLGADPNQPGPRTTPLPPRPTPARVLQHASFATAGLATDGGPSFSDERPLWENLKLDSVPRVSRLEPIPRKHWPMVLLGILAGVAVAVFYWLPRYTTQSLPFDFAALSRATKSLVPSSASASDTANGAASGVDSSSPEATFQKARDHFDQRLTTLETRGAGVWGGPEFGLAKMRAAEAIGAHDAGNTQMAEERLADASKLLDQVDGKAAQALNAQIAAGQKALATGQEETANQAFDLARRIDPNDKRIAEGQRHTHNLNGVLPLLADGQNAESAHNYSRAAQDYGQVLSLDPGNDKARAGLARANAAFGDDSYAKAVGSGFAALGAGRLDDARDAFEKARALRPNGSEAADGLRRVSSALSSKGFSSIRQRAAGLEAQERWDEAVQAYDSALQADPSLAFAQEGKDRAAARAELNASMQALIDRPERLSSPSIRDQAKALLETASQQSPSGPVLRSQITRLEMSMPDYDGTVKSATVPMDLMDKPIRLSLVSDNATAVAIPSIGQFGTFAKRDIQLKPGRYTVIGTRDGFRDVRRDVTIAPGQESQTISVSCSDPI
jgi:tetratricopeptide (TPR) repeat protein